MIDFDLYPVVRRNGSRTCDVFRACIFLSLFNGSPFTVSFPPPPGLATGMIVGISVSAGTVVIALAAIAVLCFKKRRKVEAGCVQEETRPEEIEWTVGNDRLGGRLGEFQPDEEIAGGRLKHPNEDGRLGGRLNDELVKTAL